MSNFIGLVYYKDKVDQIGGHYEDLNFKVKRYCKRAEKIEVFKNVETIFKAGIQQITKK